MTGVALVAVGGYGHGRLAPASDLDVLLLHEHRKGFEELPSRVWYPLWDAGVKVGHGVFTPKEAARLAAKDLEVATAQLSARHIAGDHALVDRVRADAEASWRKRAGGWLGELATRVTERHESAGEVAFLLEPDVKEGRGGLRDVQALRWAEAAGLTLDAVDRVALAEAEERLVVARVALHRVNSGRSDVLRLEDQDAVAVAAGFPDADALMASVSSAGRSVAWVADEAWGRARRTAKGVRPRPTGRSHRGSSCATARSSSPGRPILRPTSAPCSGWPPPLPAKPSRSRAGRSNGWRPSSRRSPIRGRPGWHGELVALLLEGRAAIAPIESLDQMGVLVRVLPEWADGPQQAPAQRVPPLHGRPAPAGGDGQRRPARRPCRPARPAGHRHPAPRPRQGPARRSHRQRGRARLGPRPTTGLHARGHRGAGDDGSPAPAAAGRGHPARPRRRRDHLGRGRGGRGRRRCSNCSTP